MEDIPEGPSKDGCYITVFSYGPEQVECMVESGAVARLAQVHLEKARMAVKLPRIPYSRFVRGKKIFFWFLKTR